MKNDFIKNKINSNKTTKKDKNKRIASIILLCLFAFWSIGSILGLSAFLGCNSAPKQASADSVSSFYQFNGSNLYFQTTCPNILDGTYSTSSANSTSNFRFSFSGSLNNENESFVTDVVFSTGYWESKVSPYSIFYPEDDFHPYSSAVFLPSDGSYSISQLPIDNEADFSYRWITQDFYCGLPNTSGVAFLSKAFFRMVVCYSTQSYFDSNVVKVVLGAVQPSSINPNPFLTFMPGNLADISMSNGFNYRQFCYNFVRYYDSDGDYIEFQLPVICGSAFRDQFLLDNRTYYLTQSGDSNDIYTDGYKEGYNVGEETGYKDGFEAGRISGEAMWYEAGRKAGLAESNPYTFIDLLGAVIDAPIAALFGDSQVVDGQVVRINGLLNFDVLGVNLSTFLGGLLMCSLVLAIIKLLL